VLLGAEVDVAEVLVDLLILVQEPFLQLLPHDFIHALLHLASLEDEDEVLCCCCAKAEPVIPMMAIAKKSFFMICRVLYGKNTKIYKFFRTNQTFVTFAPQWFRQVAD
jgi:hypothetical protein